MDAIKRSKRFMSMLPFASGLRPPASGARTVMREEEWLIRRSDLFYYHPLRPHSLWRSMINPHLGSEPGLLRADQLRDGDHYANALGPVAVLFSSHPLQAGAGRSTA